MTNFVRSKEATDRAIELGCRRRAQRNIVLGEWLSENETAIRLIQSVLCENFYANVEGDKPSENCWDDSMEAMELFIDLVASMRGVVARSSVPHTACLKALNLTNKDQSTYELLLPEVKLPGADKE